MTEDNLLVRAAFEKAMTELTGRTSFPRSPHHDGYARLGDQKMWEGWLLRHNLEPTAGPEVTPQPPKKR